MFIGSRAAQLPAGGERLQVGRLPSLVPPLRPLGGGLRGCLAGSQACSPSRHQETDSRTDPEGLAPQPSKRGALPEVPALVVGRNVGPAHLGQRTGLPSEGLGRPRCARPPGGPARFVGVWPYRGALFPPPPCTPQASPPTAAAQNTRESWPGGGQTETGEGDVEWESGGE